MKKSNVFDIKDLKISVRYGGLRPETFAKYCEALTSFNSRFIDGDSEDLQAAQDAWDLVNYYQNETIKSLQRAKICLVELLEKRDLRRVKSSIMERSLYDLEREFLKAEDERRKNSEPKSSLFIELVIEIAMAMLRKEPSYVHMLGFKR